MPLFDDKADVEATERGPGQALGDYLDGPPGPAACVSCAGRLAADGVDVTMYGFSQQIDDFETAAGLVAAEAGWTP